MRTTTSMNIGACVGLKQTLEANRPGADNSSRYPMNPYIGKKFFDSDNYKSALERLDSAYEVSMDFGEWMQEYCNIESEHARNLLLFAEKWTSRVKQQSSLISYHTTKRAQLDAIGSAKEIAETLHSVCREIQKVIDKHRAYTDETFVSERFRPGRRHNRSGEFKKLFKSAHAALRDASEELETLKSQEKKAREAVRAADCACEILELDPTVTDKQRARAVDAQRKKADLLLDIEKKLIDVKDKHKKEQKTYRIKATEIFQQCQRVEEERLEYIRETLLDFTEAMDVSKYTSELNRIFQNLTNKITTQQDSFDDILFWGKTYGIDDKLLKSYRFKSDHTEDEITIEKRKTKKSSQREIETKESSPKHVNDDDADEDLSNVTDPSAPVKAKSKKSKNSIVDKKNSNSIQPSNMSTSMLNRV